VVLCDKDVDWQVRQVLERNRYDEVLPVKATKAYWVMENEAVAVLNLGAKWCEWKVLNPVRFTPQENISRFLLNRMLCGSQNGLDERLNLW
jgi:hypothetical protein